MSERRELEVFTAVSLRVLIFLDVTSRHVVKIVTDVSNDCRGLSVIAQHRRNITKHSATLLV